MRFNERSLVVLIGVGLMLAIGIAVLLFSLFNDDEAIPRGSAATTDNAAASLEGGADEVLMMSGTALVRRSVEDGTEKIVGEIPSPSVYAAPGSHWLAYVTSKKADEGDFAAEPVLHLYDARSDEKAKHGPGVAPVWNAAGTHVAFLRPVEPRDCLGEECPGRSQIGVVEAATGRQSLLLEPGRYSILAWAGAHVLVSDFEDPSRVISVSLDDVASRLDFPASQFWDASPDGRWLVKTNERKTEFVSLEDGELGEERIPVELGTQELLQGSWSHDSATVAAVTSTTGGVHKGKKLKLVNEEQTTQLVTFSPEAPEPVLVELTYGASGDVLWDPDNDAIVFSSLIDPKRALFQARHCPVGNSGGCSIVTSWTEGVVLLRAE